MTAESDDTIFCHAVERAAKILQPLDFKYSYPFYGLGSIPDYQVSKNTTRDLLTMPLGGSSETEISGEKSIVNTYKECV